jgi:hypothetical protein
VVQAIAAERRHVQILEAIVIVVADRNAKAVPIARQARTLGHVLERAVGALAVERVPVLLPFLWRGTGRHRIAQPRAVDEEDVEPPVVVAVEDGDAAAHGLEQVLLRRDGRAMRERDACLMGGVQKRYRRRGCCGKGEDQGDRPRGRGGDTNARHAHGALTVSTAT